MKNITIKGACIHNLKNIDISIPKNKLVVVTGVSGSGKSSLIFDVIFEEARKQYLQSIGMFSKIDDEEKFKSISGIGPTIAVQQSIVRQSNPRSTVGSRTQILNMIGLLYSKEGEIICSQCGVPVDENLVCKKCGDIEERLLPIYFSYNSPDGMCIKCSGRGGYFEIDMDKLLPDNDITLQQVFKLAGTTPGYLKLMNRKYNKFMEMPFRKIPEDIKEDLIYGHYVDSNYSKQSYCLMRIFENRYKNGEDLKGIYRLHNCSDCDGYRIGEEARRVLLNNLHIGELGKMTINEVYDFFDELGKESLTLFGKNLVEEILIKIRRLINIRLGHLSLYREMSTLSGGEIQRLFLSSHLESKMDSIIYILDEPTIGLHEAEKENLLNSIRNLKELGNTVIVVEHDKSTIKMAEHIIDIGPKAGIDGGYVVYQGDFEGLLNCRDSITGSYISDRVKMPCRIVNKNITTNKSKISNEGISSIIQSITINKARTNNLKNITVSFPLGVFVGIAGVSGSGKSSLISNTLIPLIKECFQKNLNKQDKIDDVFEMQINENTAGNIEGVNYISGYAQISQAQIGRHMNSNPITYIGIWDKIRKLFSDQPEAKNEKLSAGHFSFNSKGACLSCGGSGREKIWLGGNLNIYNICKGCNGKRYSDKALSIKYKGKNIYQVLEMSISEAVEFFSENKSITSILKLMEKIGMGYIKLGQPTPTLSGGETQRIKIGKEIGKSRKGNILYLLDEPTTGLSFYDISKLIGLLNELVKKGNSVIVIEHDIDFLKCCDWIIELGPGGGDEGGRIIAEGIPAELKDNPDSIIGKYLNNKIQK